MTIFVAGATGTLGQPVVRALAARGHDVVGLTRTAQGARRIHSVGGRAVIGNALDAGCITRLVAEAAPDVIVHLLTALPPGGVLRKRQLRPTNALRIQGTGNLIAAARAARTRRVVAESFVGVYGATRFTEAAVEDAPLPPVADDAFKEAVLALRSLEEQLRTAGHSGLETVALRIGYLYGSEVPSTKLMIAQARSGRLAVPRGLSGIGPFVHIEDAASAIVAAIESPHPSPVYNIVDDRALALSEFVSKLAAAASTPPPRTLPAWIVRLGAPVIAVMASSRLPLSNAKAKHELGWRLRYPTVDEGLTEIGTIQEGGPAVGKLASS